MSCGTKHTVLFATDEERDKCQELAKQASSTPVMRLSSSSPDFSATAWERVNKTVYTAALGHGLPEIEGYYGMTLEGEFITTEGTEALLDAVIRVPRNKDAKRLVEVIYKEAEMQASPYAQLPSAWGTVRDNAERLAVLLHERDKAQGELVAAATVAVASYESCPNCDRWEGVPDDCDCPKGRLSAALAGVKGGS